MHYLPLRRSIRRSFNTLFRKKSSPEYTVISSSSADRNDGNTIEATNEANNHLGTDVRGLTKVNHNTPSSAVDVLAQWCFTVPTSLASHAPFYDNVRYHFFFRTLLNVFGAVNFLLRT